jgi:extracellular elastinolytic metalloproteinase
MGVRIRVAALLGAIAGIAALAPGSAFGLASIQPSQDGLPDIEGPPGKVQPTAAQQALASSLGATVDWNSFGTPGSLINDRGYLATGLGNDPVDAARSFVSKYRGLFRLSSRGLAGLRLLNDAPLAGSDAHAVLFQQTFGSLPSTQNGLITVGVVHGDVAYVSSSAVGDGNAPAPATLSPEDAWLKAAANVGEHVDAGDIAGSKTSRKSGVTRLRVPGLEQAQARLTAFPTVDQGVRPAYETVVLDESGTWPLAYKEFVDARTGAVLFRQNAVQELADTPRWKAFLANPPLSYSDGDTRVVECWRRSAVATCDLGVKNPSSPFAWDVNPQTRLSTHTTDGNNAVTAEDWANPLLPSGGQTPVSAQRRYSYAWTNVWHNSGCNPSNFVQGGNDIDAAVTNLFAGHNRFHDFSYKLGFTERNSNAQQSNFGKTAARRANDPEFGDVQAGAINGGAPSYVGRDNANQITLQDGIPPVTNQYLFQPIPAAFYTPCVDGDYDTSVFGHEYTHLISNRMVGGPDASLSGEQANAMGESWSDLDALEYEHEYGLKPGGGANPWAEGPYVTGNKQRGIRDYPLNANPLNYSDIGFDIPGPEVHADGEIWNATNYDIRQAMVRRYNGSFPASNQVRQVRCADGKVPLRSCPGNRRWIQIVYDAWPLMQPSVSMLDARDAYLAADRMIFNGADQRLLWLAFARHGMGVGASSKSASDRQPTPSFQAAHQPNATVRFKATGSGRKAARVKARVFVGKYQGRVTPIADTSRRTQLGDTAQFAPGTYDFVVQAPGYGLTRFSKTFRRGQRSTVNFRLAQNWASRAKGAVATGDGSRLGALIDSSEQSTWTAQNRTPTVKGTQVTVDLGGGEHKISSVRVSAMLGPDQNRFAALRRFRIEACDTKAGGGKCAAASDYKTVYTSTRDAFPGSVPRPVAPILILRKFAFKPVRATHLRFVVLSNQCTGGPGFQGDQDSDPTNNSDCVTGSSEGQEVIAAELEAFSTR